MFFKLLLSKLHFNSNNFDKNRSKIKFFLPKITKISSAGVLHSKTPASGGWGFIPRPSIVFGSWRIRLQIPKSAPLITDFWLRTWGYCRSELEQSLGSSSSNQIFRFGYRLFTATRVSLFCKNAFKIMFVLMSQNCEMRGCQ